MHMSPKYDEPVGSGPRFAAFDDAYRHLALSISPELVHAESVMMSALHLISPYPTTEHGRGLPGRSTCKMQLSAVGA